jgi:hypothetical protein
MANYRIGRKRCGVTWSNNVTEGNGRLVFKSDLEFAMDRPTKTLSSLFAIGSHFGKLAFYH